MEEECNKIIMDDQRKTINFNAPLLSTRRPANLAAIDLSSCASNCRRSSISSEDRHRIPFSWEKTPGKPKETKNDNFNDDINENDTPRPKLPPCLWAYRHVISTLTTTKNDDSFKCNTSINNNDNSGDLNNENDDINIENDRDDVFSLSEAIDIVEKSQKISSKNDGLRLKIVEDRLRNDNYYPDFMIQRFLPDATACSLSAMSLKSTPSDSLYRDYEISTTNRTISTRFSPPKGCGFEVLFPWRVKHRLCGVKSPVRRERSGAFGCISTEQVLHRRHKEKRGW